MRTSLRFLLILLLIAVAGLARAQDDPQTYTFDSGAHFTVPDGASLDDGPIPMLTLDKSIVVELLEPDVLNQIAEVRQTSDLDDLLDLLLDKVGFTGSRTEDATYNIALDDGRDAIVFDFVNSAKNYQSVLVLRTSDGQIAALNIRSLKELTDPQRSTLLALATSFDLGSGGAPSQSDAEAALTEGLGEDFAYDSGTSFKYPSAYQLVNDGKSPASVGINNVISVTMVDPAIVGMPSGEAMDDVITFAIKGSTLKADSFESLDIGGREAVIGSAKSGSAIHSMVLVRFADETVGIMDILSAKALTGQRLDEVRGIAASFNTAGTAAAPTRADIEQSTALFDQAQDALKAKDYDKAIDLFTQSLALDPTFALSYYWRGATYQDAGDLENALTDYQQALKYKPTELHIHQDIAQIYALLDDLDSAVAEFEAWIDESGSAGLDANGQAAYELIKDVAAGNYNRTFYFARADQLRLIGRFDEALRDNQTSLDNLPNDAKLYAQRGVIYMDMKQYPDAVKAFTQGIAVEPLPILFYNRGYANRNNTRNDIDAFIDSAHDFQCLLLLADDTVTDQQRKDAQQALDSTFISDDSYQPITDPAKCVK